jgi:hypothetical protein
MYAVDIHRIALQLALGSEDHPRRAKEITVSFSTWSFSSRSGSALIYPDALKRLKISDDEMEYRVRRLLHGFSLDSAK